MSFGKPWRPRLKLDQPETCCTPGVRLKVFTCCEFEMLEISLVLPSGGTESFSVPESSSVEDLNILAQTLLGKPVLRLVTADGRPLNDPEESLTDAGLRNGDGVTAIALHPQHLAAATVGAFAVWRCWSHGVLTWGDLNYGGRSAAIQHQLRNVKQVQATDTAFAAILANGSVVTWGDPDEGGDSSAVQTQLVNVQQVQGTASAFAAILADGSVITWGPDLNGGNSSRVQDQLKNVQQIEATDYAFAAIRGDGSLLTWGHPLYGGLHNFAIQDVQLVKGTAAAFAAILADGSIRTWGDRSVGADRTDAHGKII